MVQTATLWVISLGNLSLGVPLHNLGGCPVSVFGVYRGQTAWGSFWPLRWSLYRTPFRILKKDPQATRNSRKKKPQTKQGSPPRLLDYQPNQPQILILLLFLKFFCGLIVTFPATISPINTNSRSMLPHNPYLGWFVVEAVPCKTFFSCRTTPGSSVKTVKIVNYKTRVQNHDCMYIDRF